MSEFSRFEICEGVAFTSIIDNRFKRGRIGAALIVPLERKNAAANALLSCVLTRSCKKYPDFTALSRKLEGLYSAALYPSVRRIGDYQAVMLSVSGIEDQYTINGEKISAELAELLCSILLEPNIVDGYFCEEDVEQERRQLIENIDGEFNDKRIYAINRCFEVMCAGEPFSIGRYGRREDVEALTKEDIYNAWQSLLQKARIEFTMLGSTPPDAVYERFKAYFQDKPRKTDSSSMIVDRVDEVKRIVETQDVAQSKLVMGFRCRYPENGKECITSTLMSAVLGGTPTSKLFLNVREKQSLCYYCASRVDNEKAIMMIDSGVETENIEKAEKAILEQLHELIKGNITDEEINSAKLVLKNALISSLDNLAAMQAYHIGQIHRKDGLTPTEASRLVDTVTKEEIIAFAQSIKLDTVFSLIGN